MLTSSHGRFSGRGAFIIIVGSLHLSCILGHRPTEHRRIYIGQATVSGYNDFLRFPDRDLKYGLCRNRGTGNAIRPIARGNRLESCDGVGVSVRQFHLASHAADNGRANNVDNDSNKATIAFCFARRLKSLQNQINVATTKVEAYFYSLDIL